VSVSVAAAAAAAVDAIYSGSGPPSRSASKTTSRQTSRIGKRHGEEAVSLAEALAEVRGSVSHVTRPNIPICCIVLCECEVHVATALKAFRCYRSVASVVTVVVQCQPSNCVLCFFFLSYARVELFDECLSVLFYCWLQCVCNQQLAAVRITLAQMLL
jgi:hypothetical protein